MPVGVYKRKRVNKICVRCKINQVYGVGNRSQYCKLCAMLNKRERDTKYTSKWHKEQRKKYPQKTREQDRKIYFNRQLQNQAMAKVYQALSNKTLDKPIECECCGGRKKVCGHHKDYNKPLKVIWLCHKCRKFLHEYLTSIQLIEGMPSEQELKAEFRARNEWFYQYLASQISIFKVGGRGD